MEKKMLENLSLRTKLKHLFIGSCLVVSGCLANEMKAQASGIAFKTINLTKEDLVKPMNTMMDKIYSLKMSGDFDKDYVAIVKEFQQGGIDLCKIYEMSGEDPKLLEFARVSEVELKENQKQLKGFYYKDVVTTTVKPEHNDLMATLNKMMKEINAKGHTGDLNTDYASIMMLYNWANTEMAKAELAYGRNTELKKKSADIFEEFSCQENNLVEWLHKSSVAEK